LPTSSIGSRATPVLADGERHYWIPSPISHLRLFARHLAPLSRLRQQVRPVLYVHGATFPSALSIAHRFDGYSWRDALCGAGFDVWGFDLQGFGSSDPYPEMNQPADANPPLCRTGDASGQVEAVVRFILAHHGVPRLSFITHSWGCMPACAFAAHHPTMIDRLMLFAPIAKRPAIRYEEPPRGPAWRVVTLEDQWARFVEDVPAHEEPVLSRRHFDEWGERYLDSDPESRLRDPAGVKIPTGPFTDILAAWHGRLEFDPASVQAPIAIVRGSWDGLISDADARWLFDAFSGSPFRSDVKISRGTHLMHLETMRHALYRQSITFLLSDDPPTGTPSSRHRTPAHEGDDGNMTNMPGYTYGSDAVAKSPISMADWQELQKSALFSEEDVLYLRLSEQVLSDQIDDLLKVWRGIIFDHPHLRAYDEDPRTHEVDTEYTGAVARRFGQWVIDTARAKYDQQWLDYQYEIGLRHHRSKKNKTDGGHTLDHIRARDLMAFCASIVAPMKPYLAKKGHPVEIVNRMYDAWWKSMILQATLWMQPYVREGDF
jgi:pimeloyl-ACP methyl ester carboxylesterase